MRLHYLVAQALERLDVRENLLSESERLLGRIGERPNRLAIRDIAATS